MPVPLTRRSTHTLERPSASLLAILLLTVQLLPPLPLYMGVATSMALGTTMAGAAIVFICWLDTALGGKTPLLSTIDFAVSPTIVAIAVMSLVLAHSIVADGIQSSDMTRSVASYVPLACLLVGSGVFGNLLFRASDQNVDFAVRMSVYALICVLVLKILGLQPRGDHFSKSMFPFQETSHFALALAPIAMYQCVLATGRRQLWLLIISIILGLALQSLALLAGCLLIAVACRRLLLLFILALPVGLIGVPLGLDYFRSRLDFSGTVLNLSNLVYVQGWQLVQESLIRSRGWGLGFSQLGVRPTEVDAARLIELIMNGDNTNVMDGSFVFSKLVSEFGIFGLLLTVLYLVGAGHCLMALRAGNSRCAITLARCIVVAYGVDVFVRGPGYFVESTLLFAGAAAALLATRRPSLIVHAIKRRLHGARHDDELTPHGRSS